MTVKMTRRALAAVLALGATAFAGAANAQATNAAQNYPTRAVKFIVPVPAGGAADVMSRMIAAHLQAKFGQPFVVENRPGAGSSLGMDVVAKAAPDGYTIGLGNVAANAINPAVKPGVFPYHPVKDFAAVSMVGVTPLILVVNAEKVQATGVPAFIAYLKANPGKFSYGSSGVGSSLHLAMELFLMRTGTSMIHIPYKGSAPMVTELIGGHIEASIDAATTSLPQVKAGKLRALGVSTKERAFFAPEIAPIADHVPGFDVRPWHGVVAPAGTPQAIVDKLSTEIQAFLRQSDTETKLRDAGVVRVGSSAKDFAKTMQDDFELYTKVVKDANIKAD